MRFLLAIVLLWSAACGGGTIISLPGEPLDPNAYRSQIVAIDETLASMARRTTLGTSLLNSPLRQQWLRVRGSTFDDAAWFRHSSADPVESAVPPPAWGIDIFYKDAYHHAAEALRQMKALTGLIRSEAGSPIISYRESPSTASHCPIQGWPSQ